VTDFNLAARMLCLSAALWKSVTQQFNTEQRACTKDEDDVAETNAQLMAKNKDLQASVSFVMRNCQEADAAENEVGETIGIVTQIEVVNRLYNSYFKQITEYNRQEKIYEQSRITFERESSRITSLISQYNSRIETAQKTIATLKEKIKTIESSTSTSTTTTTTTT
jgi:DNA repair exonuclease SbcCD ATPase subunit